MAKLDRKDVKIFAENSKETLITEFRTEDSEGNTASFSRDPDVIQNENYSQGWVNDTNNLNTKIYGEDLNAVNYVLSYLLKYLYENGIAEWKSTTTYYQNSICKVDNALYLSLQNNNTGNDPTSTVNYWKLIPLENVSIEDAGSGFSIVKDVTDNVITFKTISVTGYGEITDNGDQLNIDIAGGGGGGSGDAYWGTIRGTITNQTDLQQALNLKQNLIGYTPEDVSNKITTVRTDTVATDTAYPTELATRTAIDSAVSSANTYTDNALLNLSSDVFILYAETWTDANTGTLTTVKPTGNGTTTTSLLVGTSPTTIATFSYTTTSKTVIDPSFFYDIYIQCRGRDSSPSNSYFIDVKLTIEHPDVLGGVPSVLVDNGLSYDYSLTTTGEIRTPIKTQTKLNYPAGSVIKLQIKAMADEPNSPISLLVYDLNQPIVISQNQYLQGINATCVYTQTPIGMHSQANYNTYLFEQIENCSPAFTATAPLNFYINKLTIAKANSTTDGYLTSTDWNTFNNKYHSTNTGINMYHTTDTTTIRPIVEAGYENSYIGTSSYPFTNGYITNVYCDNLNAKTTAISINTNLNPDSTSNNRNLGSSSNRFNNGWISYIKTRQLEAMGGGSKLNLGYNCLSPEVADTFQLGYGSRYAYVYSAHFDQGSDIRNKKNIKDYEASALEKIKNITPITYNYKNEEQTTLGVSAQELRELEPLLVNAQKTADGKDETLGIDIYSLCVFALKAIKELNAKVEKLEAKIEELENK